jgi:hypothetical protein
MPEVLNVEMLWQGAIRWKGMHVKKNRRGKKIENHKRENMCVCVCVCVHVSEGKWEWRSGSSNFKT